MSKKLLNRSSVMLGTGDVYFMDASGSNYSSILKLGTSSNFVSRVDNVRIYSSKEYLKRKTIDNGYKVDSQTEVIGSEFFVGFDYMESTVLSQSIMFGDIITGSTSPEFSFLLKSPSKLRIEVCFTFPVGGQKQWYVFPKCCSETDLDFSPTNQEGFNSKAIFRALPATNDNSVWYTASTPCFHSYRV